MLDKIHSWAYIKSIGTEHNKICCSRLSPILCTMLNPRAGLIVCWRQRHQQSEILVLTSTLSRKTDDFNHKWLLIKYHSKIIDQYKLTFASQDLGSITLSTTGVRHRVDAYVTEMTRLSKPRWRNDAAMYDKINWWHCKVTSSIRILVMQLYHYIPPK